ncbi:hypothetical protein Dimus_025463 [Dionaea muscipula]
MIGSGLEHARTPLTRTNFNSVNDRMSNFSSHAGCICAVLYLTPSPNHSYYVINLSFVGSKIFSGDITGTQCFYMVFYFIKTVGKHGSLFHFELFSNFPFIQTPHINHDGF